MTWKRGVPEKEARNRAVLLMRQGGARYREIAEAFGISRQRAHRIVRQQRSDVA